MSKTTLADGSPVSIDHRVINPSTGQQKGYVVLSEDERAKGFVRPVRHAYVHIGDGAQFDGAVQIKAGSGCGVLTIMSQAIAETYARDPSFYSGTFCCGCRKHLPLSEVRWDGTSEVVGS